MGPVGPWAQLEVEGLDPTPRVTSRPSIFHFDIDWTATYYICGRAPEIMAHVAHGGLTGASVRQALTSEATMAELGELVQVHSDLGFAPHLAL